MFKLLQNKKMFLKIMTFPLNVLSFSQLFGRISRNPKNELSKVSLRRSSSLEEYLVCSQLEQSFWSKSCKRNNYKYTHYDTTI